MKSLKVRRNAGMSYIQMIATVAVVGVISGVAMMKMINVNDVAEEQRLGNQVASLNSAVKIYVSSGGSLENLTSAQSVVDKMKTMAANSEKIAGFGGTFVDPRLRVVEQSDEEAAVTGELRVIWDVANQSFRIADSGQKGIKEFEIDSTATPATIITEERETMFELSATNESQGAWVWDFDTETSASASAIVTTAGGDPNLDIDPSVGNYTKQQLLQPSLDPPPGTFPLNEFGVSGLEVVVFNPNPGEYSDIYASVNGAYWTFVEDGGTVTVPPGGSLSVFVKVKTEASEEYYSSYVRSGRYEGTTTTLSIPIVPLSAPSFHPLDEAIVTVTITHGNNTDHGKVQYSIGSGQWVDYKRPFDLAIEDHIAGTTIYARSVATQWSEYYLASDTVEKPLPTTTHTLEDPTVTVAPLSLHPVDSDTVEVTLGDPNTDDGPISSLQYSLNGADWVDYEGPVTLGIDDYSDGVDVVAKAIPVLLAGAILESDEVNQIVDAIDVTLDSPGIALSESDFHPLDHQTVTVTLSNPNSAEVSAVEYELNNSGEWLSYEEPVALEVLDHLVGVIVNARAVPTIHTANIFTSVVEDVAVGVLEATLVVPEIASSSPVLNPQGYPTATITLTDTNSPGFSNLVYSVDAEATWVDYTEPFVLAVADYPEGVTIVARAEPVVIPELINISVTGSLELTVPPKLDSPVFGRAAGGYVKSQFDQGITLTSSNATSDGALKYRINGGDWTDYSDAIVLTSWPSTIEAYVGALEYLDYQDSGTVTAVYERIYLTPDLAFGAEASGLPFLIHEFTGEAYGQFKDPVGDSGMVYVLDDNYFEWGESSGYLGFENGSYLEYIGAAWENVQAGELFRLGTLDYFNGSIYSGTQATDITLDLTIALTLPDTNESFDINIELENTTNSDNNTEDQNADYIRISTLDTDFSTTIDGIQYELNLAFGYTGDQGFTTIDQFHVHEGATTTADLWGYFTTDDF